MQLLCILGRQPALGRSELESRFDAEALRIVSDEIVLLETDQDIALFEQIGGTQKVAKLLTYFDTSDWNKTLRQIQKYLPGYLKSMADGKITIGLSTHGFNASAKQINAAALSLKKIIKQSGRSARVVPNSEATLNTAQVIHNKLTGANGLELIVIRDKNRTILAQTTWVQDIDSYRRRDQERPMRDARVGMLPPKLAQIIINLAVSNTENEEIALLDPFCGTGVLLQEALLNGYDAAGTDLEPRMVEYSIKNLNWLNELTSLRGNRSIVVADATTKRWQENFDTIACETYLGRALSSMPDLQTLQKIITDCDTIHAKFLKNVTRQTQSGFRMCIAVPAWRTRNGFKHLPVLDHLEKLGYNRISFVHANTQDLIYYRENQIVARELIVLTRR